MVGGDFASILACEAVDDMRDLLNQISNGRAEFLFLKQGKDLLSIYRAFRLMRPSR